MLAGLIRQPLDNSYEASVEDPTLTLACLQGSSGSRWTTATRHAWRTLP